MQRWLAGGNTVDDVFKLLKLNKAGDDLLISPLLDTWSTYMQIANKENPAKKTTLFATLTAHYSDNGLARMIEAAKKVKSKANTAKRVEVTQIQTWLGNKQTPGDVFKLLKLNNAVDDVLTSPALNTWSNYLNVFN
ncbi:putative secreted RxLR effector peptide protein [Phytophthora cinnamomi]|uniref:putative secreted RxLR effector peptide protein n=1 Tax=Phytophthora cinnamomi TaxID=4785 RepID=UPI00355A0944|nr:putative secreted RxLR effector peptide protein [Phytophthora cinnamomi]